MRLLLLRRRLWRLRWRGSRVSRRLAWRRLLVGGPLLLVGVLVVRGLPRLRPLRLVPVGGPLLLLLRRVLLLSRGVVVVLHSKTPSSTHINRSNCMWNKAPRRQPRETSEHPHRSHRSQVRSMHRALQCEKIF